MFVRNFATMIDPRTVPVTPITTDWFGKAVASPTAFGFATDPDHFHFRATRDAPACVHPDARPGVFTPNLWQFDAAEFFLVHPDTGRYLEFNLAPNGAWWSCEFTAPRRRSRPDDIPFPDVTTAGRIKENGWEATASLPLPALRTHFGFGPDSRLNATFTIAKPTPIFLTASPLGPGEPDFHQPDRLPLIETQSP